MFNGILTFVSYLITKPSLWKCYVTGSQIGIDVIFRTEQNDSFVSCTKGLFLAVTFYTAVVICNTRETEWKARDVILTKARVREVSSSWIPFQRIPNCKVLNYYKYEKREFFLSFCLFLSRILPFPTLARTAMLRERKNCLNGTSFLKENGRFTRKLRRKGCFLGQHEGTGCCSEPKKRRFYKKRKFSFGLFTRVSTWFLCLLYFWIPFWTVRQESSTC